VSIPQETRSSEHLVRYCRYHVAALGADPQATHLVASTQRVLDALRAAVQASSSAESTRLAAAAVFNRKDFDLDEVVRVCELEVLAAVGKDRGQGDYRIAFPQGLSALVGLRGKEEATQVRELASVLRSRFSDVAVRHADTLERLATEMASAEDTLKAAERTLANAVTEEYVARAELVRQLHSNQGALRALYPRDRPRVASYFLATRRRGGASEEDVVEGGDDSEVTPAE
jgi:hypothetical protein